MYTNASDDQAHIYVYNLPVVDRTSGCNLPLFERNLRVSITRKTRDKIPQPAPMTINTSKIGKFGSLVVPWLSYGFGGLDSLK